MCIRAGQGMLGRYFPHFRLVRTAFHAFHWGRGRECVWEGRRVSSLPRCFSRTGRCCTSKREWNQLGVNLGTSSHLKYVAFMSCTTAGYQWHACCYVVILVFVGNSSTVILALIRQRGNGVSWVDYSTSSRLKYVTVLDVVHDCGIPMACCYVVMLVFAGNRSTVVILALIRIP